MNDDESVAPVGQSSASTLRWDPFDAAIDVDPYPLWKRLRDEAPVYYNADYDFYALSRFADVEPAHGDSKTFLSGHGTVLELMGPEPLRTGQLMFMDPPDHTRLRALVSRSFTARRVSRLEDSIREITVELLDRLQGRDHFDFVQDFAALLPSRVISSLLGIPQADQEMLRQHIDRIFFIEPGVGMINETSFSAQLAINAYIREQLVECRRRPRDDMLTDLTKVEVVDDDGARRQLSDAQAADFGNLLISAGTETVARMLGWAAMLLAAHPSQRAELAAAPELIPGAVEETLRFEAPSPVTGRWTTRDLTYYGIGIPAKSKVLLLAGSANRDERQFSEPDRFDVHRRVEQHLSFGLGAHFCIGSALARMEGRIALEEVLRRYPEWDVDDSGSARAHTSTVRGWSKLPVRV